MTSRTYTIRLSEVMLDLVIGIYEHEKGAPQRVGLAIDVEMRQDYSAETFLNYDLLANHLTKTVAARSYPLQEDLADDIADFVLGFEQVQAVRIEVSKPDAYGDAALVGLRLDARRDL